MATGEHDLRAMTLTWRRQMNRAKFDLAISAGFPWGRIPGYDEWLEQFILSVFDRLNEIEASRNRPRQLRPEDV